MVNWHRHTEQPNWEIRNMTLPTSKKRFLQWTQSDWNIQIFEHIDVLDWIRFQGVNIWSKTNLIKEMEMSFANFGNFHISASNFQLFWSYLLAIKLIPSLKVSIQVNHWNDEVVIECNDWFQLWISIDFLVQIHRLGKKQFAYIWLAWRIWAKMVRLERRRDWEGTCFLQFRQKLTIEIITFSSDIHFRGVPSIMLDHNS